MANTRFSQNSTPMKQLGPDYSVTFSWENNFDYDQSVELLENYAYIPFIIGIGLYLPILYFVQKIMANREPMKLRGPLIVWNSALAIFSIIGFVRVFPEFLYTFQHFGFKYTVCNNSYITSKPARFWIYLFVLSKTPELFDTLFLVLKKQKLIFLHVYHHATVVLYAWFVYSNRMAGARWFSTMNLGVHSIMYTYYALKAMPNLVRIPKWVSMIITISQTMQMIAGTYVVAVAFHAHINGEPCATNTLMSIVSLIIYGSYLILFAHFFYRAYCAPAPSKSKEAAKKIA